MTKAKLMSMVGETVIISFHDGHVEIGKLGYTSKFCEEQGWRKPNYFTINDWDFKVSHIKKCTKVIQFSCICWEGKK